MTTEELCYNPRVACTLIRDKLTNFSKQLSHNTSITIFFHLHDKNKLP